MAPNTEIELYTAGTPNGHKISITLEELGLQYNVHKLEFSKNQQKEPWFLEINPNGRIPAIVDKTSGKPKRVFEGASMQLYLCEKYDKDHKISFPYDSDEYWETVEWLVWMIRCLIITTSQKDSKFNNQMAPNTEIELYTAGTPNGHKISITLEELGLQYNVHKLEFSKNQQKEPWFLEINPNGRIPAIVDKTSGKPKRVFEGASMQLYLCEKYDKDHKISFPYDSDEYWETVEWLVWMIRCLIITTSQKDSKFNNQNGT